MNSLVLRLLNKGAEVAVEGGRLNIYPSGGQEVPSDWYRGHAYQLASDIVQALGHPVYRFSHHNTGKFNQGKCPGVLLHFVNLLTGEDAFAIFNASLKRQRNSKTGKAGDALPDGQFNLGARSAFHKFWIRAGLSLPHRPAEWHKSMYKLQPILFTADCHSSGKLANNSLMPLSLTTEEVEVMFGDKAALSQRQASDKTALRNGVMVQRQESALRNGVIESAESHIDKGLEGESNYVSEKVRVTESACVANYVSPKPRIKSLSKEYNVFPIGTNRKDPREQSHDEWWADYDSAG